MNEQVKLNKRVISQTCAMMIANIVKKILCLSKLQLSKFGTFYLDIILYQNIPIYSLMKWS